MGIIQTTDMDIPIQINNLTDMELSQMLSSNMASSNMASNNMVTVRLLERHTSNNFVFRFKCNEQSNIYELGSHLSPHNLVLHSQLFGIFNIIITKHPNITLISSW